MMAIKGLLLGISHDQVARLYGTTRRNLCRWIDRFNTSGIDGLVQKPRSGRPRKITPDKRTKYIELVQRPDRANETNWTGKKFHGYLTKKLDEEIGYRTVVRWLHEQGFRLKVPRSWPNGRTKKRERTLWICCEFFLATRKSTCGFLTRQGSREILGPNVAGPSRVKKSVNLTWALI